MKNVLVLGCTGSIGKQTLDIIRNNPDDFKVCGLSAKSSKTKLEELCREFNCAGTLFDEDGLEGIKKLISTCNADIAVNGIAGSPGLEPSLFVLENSIDLALANKETVVMAWPLVKETALKHNAKIIPVDSEHSAIFCLSQRFGNENISELVITASGGPFKNFSHEQLENATLEQALKHPTWNMGQKITVDSASLANKGLEVIEACRLFDFSTDKVKVVVHPESIVHSLIRTNDGVLYGQISDPDMRHPIYTALTWPHTKSSYLKPFDLFDHTLTFFKPRYEDFPMLNLAYLCAEKGNSYPIAFNAANEIAVDYFIRGELKFLEIAECTEQVLQNDFSEKAYSLDAIFQNDIKARKAALEFCKNRR